MSLGQVGDEFYLLLQGSADVWKPFPEEKYLSRKEVEILQSRVGEDIYSLKEVNTNAEIIHGVAKTKHIISTFKKVHRLEVGSGFGEQALINNLPRYIYIYIYIYLHY